MKVKFVLPIALMLICVFTGTSYGGSNGIPEPLTFSAPKFELEDLAAEVLSDGTLLVVSGKIRNLSFATTKGHVVIYFRNENDDPIGSVDADVNDKGPFPHGKAGYFEETVNIENTPGIENISIEFVEN